MSALHFSFVSLSLYFIPGDQDMKRIKLYEYNYFDAQIQHFTVPKQINVGREVCVRCEETHREIQIEGYLVFYSTFYNDVIIYVIYNVSFSRISIIHRSFLKLIALVLNVWKRKSNASQLRKYFSPYKRQFKLLKQLIL